VIEVPKLNLGEFDHTNDTLKILGKGCCAHVEIINIEDSISLAISGWLAVRPGTSSINLIFIVLDFSILGYLITGD
jgi:hypothetical protein